MKLSELHSVLEVLEEGAYMVDLERRVVFWNKAAEKISGYAEAPVMGSRCSDNILCHISAEGTLLCTNGCPLKATIEDGASREAEAYLHNKNGHRVPVYIRSAALRNDDGEILGAIEIFSDKTDRGALLQELEQLRQENLIDALTKLGNRRYLEIIGEVRLAGFRENGVGFAMLMVDIDNFKRVNDTYGHQTGDKVIRMAAGSILGAVRQLDAAVRYGGEEFVILCPNCDLEEAKVIAERIRMLVSNAWLSEEEGLRLGVTVSVGGALSQKGDDIASIIQRADSRMYLCKEGGRNRSLVGE